MTVFSEAKHIVMPQCFEEVWAQSRPPPSSYEFTLHLLADGS